MSKITYDEYRKMLLNGDVDDQQILEYSLIVKGEGGFDFVLLPDHDRVEMTPAEIEVESAMGIGNDMARYRRSRRFEYRLEQGESLPVLVSEGDSWFQFPFLIREVIDHLEKDYLIWSVGAAGDTAGNMIYGPQAKKKTEYMQALRKQKESVKGFLFSAAGNDIIGEDPATQKSALFDILKPFDPNNPNDVSGHINHAVLGERLTYLRDGYKQVVANVRSEPGIENIPIFVHGYDYAFPFPYGDEDPRDPKWAQNDEWLGEPMNQRGIQDPKLRRAIIKTLIDAVYDMLEGVAGDSQATGVWVVDCRGAMPKVTDWADEIHGTSKGFAKVAERFRQAIGQVV